MALLFLVLGSNLGDRKQYLDTALSRLESSLGSPPKAVSQIINTQSYGFVAPDFLNCIAVFESRKRPQTILRICKQIEKEMGREDKIEYDINGNRIYRNRIIDIDILLYGDKCINTPELIIPHPQIRQRAYVTQLLNILYEEYKYLQSINLPSKLLLVPPRG